jgi:hypothetical protein
MIATRRPEPFAWRRNQAEPVASAPARSRPASLDAREASYPLQPSSFMAQPAFQILVMWLILPSSNSIT